MNILKIIDKELSIVFSLFLFVYFIIPY